MSPHRHRARLAALPLVLALGPALRPGLGAQPRPHAGAFVIRLGTDTTAVERWSRTADAYSIEQVVRSPRTSLRHTHLELTPAGEIGTFFLMHHDIEKMDAPLLASTKLVWSGGDSASVEAKRAGGADRTTRVAAPRGGIPALQQSFLPYELAAMRLRAARADSMTVSLVSPSGEGTPVIVRRLGADSMTFTLPFLTYRARVDDAGRILSLSVPLGTSVERVPAVDVNRLAKAWSALDAAGKAMGMLSPLDSASARLGGATVAVVYSRPKLRGRTAWGAMVPWDSVWRTGANAATVFRTDRDLEIGGTRVPAGAYTLFTINSRTASTLVLSRETMRNGQPLAGTAYDRAHDLARIPLAVRRLSAPVEAFTIEVVPQGGDRATLRLAWGTREMTAPVRVR